MIFSDWDGPLSFPVALEALEEVRERLACPFGPFDCALVEVAVHGGCPVLVDSGSPRMGETSWVSPEPLPHDIESTIAKDSAQAEDVDGSIDMIVPFNCHQVQVKVKYNTAKDEL